ncbi:MAG: helix-turn-helix transcriptional regulator [Bryobacteraceae bacterium]
MNLGRAIKTCRTNRGMTQGELAKKAKLSVSHLSLLERGLRDPTVSVVERIAKALRIPMSVLVFLAAEPNELVGLSTEVREKLSALALSMMREG